MPTFTYNHTVTIESRECPDCGVVYGLTEEFTRQRLKNHKTWYCPNGHQRYYSGENEEEKAKRLLRQTETALAAARQDLASERKSHSSTKGELTKTRNRIQNGVCPECHRHFANLEAHMHTKHPTP